MKTKYILLLFLGIYVSFFLKAQEETTKGLLWSAAHGLEYSVKAGFNVGGTAPVPLPEEIRAIDSYNPQLALFIEGNVTKWFNPKWGFQTGIKLETKGMETKARVKNYNLEISYNGEPPITGRWTGMVKTKVHNIYLTVPLLATYNLSSRWKLQGGFFLSYLTDGEFSGDAYEGYLRDGDPTGNKIEFEEDQRASYDFSDDLRRFQWGGQLGAEWRAFKHLTVNSNLTWGFNDIFKSSFETITFSMYPIYLNVGFGYAF